MKEKKVKMIRMKIIKKNQKKKKKKIIMKGMKIEEINIMKEILEIINQEKKVMIALVIALIVEEISILEIGIKMIIKEIIIMKMIDIMIMDIMAMIDIIATEEMKEEINFGMEENIIKSYILYSNNF